MKNPFLNKILSKTNVEVKKSFNLKRYSLNKIANGSEDIKNNNFIDSLENMGIIREENVPEIDSVLANYSREGIYLSDDQKDMIYSRLNKDNKAHSELNYNPQGVKQAITALLDYNKKNTQTSVQNEAPVQDNDILQYVNNNLGKLVVDQNGNISKNEEFSEATNEILQKWNTDRAGVLNNIEAIITEILNNKNITNEKVIENIRKAFSEEITMKMDSIYRNEEEDILKEHKEKEKKVKGIDRNTKINIEGVEVDNNKKEEYYDSSTYDIFELLKKKFGTEDLIWLTHKGQGKKPEGYRPMTIAELSGGQLQAGEKTYYSGKTSQQEKMANIWPDIETSVREEAKKYGKYINNEMIQNFLSEAFAPRFKPYERYAPTKGKMNEPYYVEDRGDTRIHLFMESPEIMKQYSDYVFSLTGGKLDILNEIKSIEKKYDVYDKLLEKYSKDFTFNGVKVVGLFCYLDNILSNISLKMKEGTIRTDEIRNRDLSNIIKWLIIKIPEIGKDKGISRKSLNTPLSSDFDEDNSSNVTDANQGKVKVEPEIEDETVQFVGKMFRDTYANPEVLSELNGIKEKAKSCYSNKGDFKKVYMIDQMIDQAIDKIKLLSIKGSFNKEIKGTEEFKDKILQWKRERKGGSLNLALKEDQDINDPEWMNNTQIEWRKLLEGRIKEISDNISNIGILKLKARQMLNNGTSEDQVEYSIASEAERYNIPDIMEQVKKERVNDLIDYIKPTPENVDIKFMMPVYLYMATINTIYKKMNSTGTMPSREDIYKEKRFINEEAIRLLKKYENNYVGNLGLINYNDEDINNIFNRVESKTIKDVNRKLILISEEIMNTLQMMRERRNKAVTNTQGSLSYAAQWSKQITQSMRDDLPLWVSCVMDAIKSASLPARRIFFGLTGVDTGDKEKDAFKDLYNSPKMNTSAGMMLNNLFIKTANKIDKLRVMKKNLVKLSSNNSIDKLIDDIINKAKIKANTYLQFI